MIIGETIIFTTSSDLLVEVLETVMVPQMIRIGIISKLYRCVDVEINGNLDLNGSKENASRYNARRIVYYVAVVMDGV